MIKYKIRQHLVEIHDVERKKSVTKNLGNAIQSLADACRYIDSSCEEMDNQKIHDKLIKIKQRIMTDSGLGTGFDETKDPDLISELKKVVDHLSKEIDGLVGKYDLHRF